MIFNERTLNIDEIGMGETALVKPTVTADKDENRTSGERGAEGTIDGDRPVPGPQYARSSIPPVGFDRQTPQNSFLFWAMTRSKASSRALAVVGATGLFVGVIGALVFVLFQLFGHGAAPLPEAAEPIDGHWVTIPSLQKSSANLGALLDRAVEETPVATSTARIGVEGIADKPGSRRSFRTKMAANEGAPGARDGIKSSMIPSATTAADEGAGSEVAQPIERPVEQSVESPVQQSVEPVEGDPLEQLIDTALAEPSGTPARSMDLPQTLSDDPIALLEARPAPTTPTPQHIKAAMEAVSPAVKRCGQGKSDQIRLRLAVAGATGRVVDARPSREDVHAGTALGLCAARRAKLAKLPKFEAEIFIIEHDFSI